MKVQIVIKKRNPGPIYKVRVSSKEKVHPFSQGEVLFKGRFHSKQKLMEATAIFLQDFNPTSVEWLDAEVGQGSIPS